MKKFLLTILFLMFLVSIVSAGTFGLSETHGETWIEWNWTVPPSHLDNNTYLRVSVDGDTVYNFSLVTGGAMRESYNFAGLGGNENHVLEIDEFNSSGSLIFSESKTALTSQPSLYYYLIFLVGVSLLIASLFLRNKIVKSILSVFSVILFLDLAVVHISLNYSFTIINIIFAVASGFVLIYTLNSLVFNWKNWEGD